MSDMNTSSARFGAGDVVSVAELVADYCGSRYSLWSLPGEVSVDASRNRFTGPTGNKHAADSSGLTRQVLADLREVLRNKFIQRVGDYSERGYLLLTQPTYGVGIARKGDGEVQCLKGAVVDDRGGAVVIDLEGPAVDEVVAGLGECSFRDRVCVLAELVCLFSDHVRLGRGRVGEFGELVALLRGAICEGGDGEAGDAGGAADDGDEGSDVHATTVEGADRANRYVLVCPAENRPGYVEIWNAVTDERVLIHADGVPDLIRDLARAVVEAQS